MSRLDEPLAKLVGDRTAKVLAKSLSLTTLGDLLRHYPRRYAERGRLTDLSRLEVDEHITVMAEIAKVSNRRFQNRRGSLLEVVVTDGRGKLKLTFFNQGWRERELRPGLRGLFAGKVARFRDELQLNQPDYQLMDADDDGSGAAKLFADALIPVYPAAAAMSSWTISQCVRVALDTLGEVGDPLPAELLRRRDMPGLRQAFQWIHAPASWGEVDAAKERLKWDEAFVLQIALARRRMAARTQTAVPRSPRPDGLLAAFDARLPFTLTDGQVDVGGEIAADLGSEHPMHRLLQGEVGSGKAQPLDALVLTPRGFVPMGDIAVGTEVVTPSGEVAVVDGVFPQGVRDVWRITLQDRTSVECDDEHLWVVSRGRQSPPQVLTTRQIREDPYGVHRWSIGSAVPVDLGSGPPPTDPYEAGRRFAEEADPGRIPSAFLNASVKDRLALLQGWMDVRGLIVGSIDFSAPTLEIGEDIAWLVRSLGGLALELRGPGDEDSGDVYWFVTQFPGDVHPFRHKYESSREFPPSDAGARRISSVEYVGPRPVQCISVAHPDHMYVTDNFTPTHNTMIALRAMLTVVDAGGQAAMLAPTEVLAQQHHRSIVEMMGDLADGPGMLGGSDNGTKVTLLTGSMGVPARRAALLDLVTGEAGIVIGTHALIEDKVKFHDLGLVVVDEQHRFGVEQRDALRGKAERPPHLLVMTATPIPRTVAMTVFGDLETSVLDQLPSGRSPIATHVVPAQEKPNFLERAWQRVREEVEKGHQAYIVCPRIGDEEDDPKAGKKRKKKAAEEDLPPEAYLDDPDDMGPDADGGAEKRPPLAVLDIAAGLEAGPLHGLRIGVLHGRMAPDAKDDVMRRFTAGELDVLVATTVIEVGVNVPNATVMVIMDSERFGVSQLHQLRGRVGRGSAPGLCLLVSDMPAGTAARERLDAVAATLDGFELSRIDLEQRREGDVLGEAQSGSRSSLRMLAVVRDEDVIVAARDEAGEIVARDPELAEHPELRSALASLLDDDRAEYLDKG